MSDVIDFRTENVDPVPDVDLAPSLHRDCDRPIDRCLGFKDLGVVENTIGLSLAPDKDVRQMRATLIANLMIACAANVEYWIFYSRDRSHYSATASRRYGPGFCNYRSTLASVVDLEAAGLVEHDRTPPSPTARFRSRLRATPDFSARLRLLGAGNLRRTPHEPVVLRNNRKRPIDYSDTRFTKRMRDDARAHNAFLANRVIALEHPNCQPTPQGWIFVEDRAINSAFHCYYRVFNRDFQHGGRWYGPWWQSVPRRYRSALTIDGVATVELDIKTCHPRLLCALAGIELPFTDPGFDFYDVAGECRSSVKLAVNILLNATTTKAARLALASELRRRGITESVERAHSLMDAVVRQWPQLSRFWSSGIGLRLQNIDAEICRRVQHSLRRADAPCLSIHDSFVVTTAHETVLADAMAEEMVRTCAQLRRRSS